MAYLYPGYKLAAGKDNIGGLAIFETLVSGFEEAQEAPSSFAKWTRGVRKETGDGLDYWGGKPSMKWRVNRCTQTRYILLRDTYEGPVTVQTLKDGIGGTYAIYNGVLKLDELPELDNPPGTTIFLDFEMMFKKLVYLQDAP